MHTVDLIAFAPHMYTMEGEGVGYKADHALVVDGGKIVAVMKRKRHSALIRRKRYWRCRIMCCCQG